MERRKKMLIATLEPRSDHRLLVTPEMRQLCAQIELVVAESVNETITALKEHSIGAMVVAVDDDCPALHVALRAFSKTVGPLPRFQAVYSIKSTPNLLNAAFESGVEIFFSPATISVGLANLCGLIQSTYDDASRSNPIVEDRIVQLMQAIRQGKQDGVLLAISNLQSFADNDFRAAYCIGLGNEARSDFDSAQSWYKASVDLNPMFRPARFGLAEARLVAGKLDDALETLLQLEREYSSDVDRKSALASVYIEKQDFETARKYALEAESLAPNHSRTLEALAQIHINTKEFPEAFALIDRMEEVGPYFAAKMNEVGIQLSQTGEVATALLLYEKAHKVVRSELKYKISMNSALALRKMGDFRGALELAVRCESEYGGLFPKLEKLKVVLLEEQAQSKGVA